MTDPHNTFSAANLSTSALHFAEEFVEPTEAQRDAGDQAIVLGVGRLSSGTVATLSFLARLADAEAVVEVGTSAGDSGLALFAGMNPRGVLTSIDLEADRQLQARKTYLAAGIASQRFRLIQGAALDVLPKLRDGAYDLVFVNGDKLEYVEYLAQALRLLRHGGVVVLNDALWQGKVADESNEDDETLIIREALTSALETEEFTPVLWPIGGGLLAAVKQ